MTAIDNSLLSLVEQLRRNAPELIGLLCSRNEEEFDKSLEGVLQRAVDHLEKNASLLAGLREEGISAYLVAFLNMPGLRAIQEAHSNGHVDITVEAEHYTPIRRRLGEAKIYDGPLYHVEGLEQLVGRYLTGREGGGFLVEYVRQPGIERLVEKLRSYMNVERPCSQEGDCADSDIDWAFSSNHHHDSGSLLRVLHLNCNLHRTS